MLEFTKKVSQESVPLRNIPDNTQVIFSVVVFCILPAFIPWCMCFSAHK